jgi:4,5-dihydroxyphthalate decarboxylase
MVPHAGVFVHARSGIAEPDHLVGKRVGCNSFGTNYSVWWRGILAHQYDVPIQQITWVQSIPEHRADYRPPARFLVETLPGNVRSEPLLAEGKLDAATTAGAGQGPKSPDVRPLFADAYAEMRAFVERFRFVPLNTVIIVRRAAIERDADLPRRLLDAFDRARARRQALEPPDEEVYRRLERDTGQTLTAFGFDQNHIGIREGIAYAYEQGIIRRLYDAEALFLPLRSP